MKEKNSLKKEQMLNLIEEKQRQLKDLSGQRNIMLNLTKEIQTDSKRQSFSVSTIKGQARS